MEPSFWTSRWEEGKTGFHMERVHPALQQHCSALVGQECKVLVPLAGKSWDVAWLADSGHQTVAVELSPVAAEAFHVEQEREHHRVHEGPYTRYFSENLEYRVGNIFDLPEAERYNAIWDRAALVALQPEQRVRYSQLLTARTEPGAKMLLSTFEYDQSEMPGPPHSVPLTEVQALYEPAWEVRVLERKELQDEKFRQRGLTHLLSNLLLLTRR